MPPKVRDLEGELKQAGFVWRSGKGSHRNYEHPSGVKIVMSGQLGADAKRYQEREVGEAIARSKAGGVR